MIKDFKDALVRFGFLLETLEEMTATLEVAMKDDKWWFSFGHRIARKFLNQAYSLQLFFYPRVFEYPNGNEVLNEDISSMLSMVRMQFETHATFYHFFVPCEDMEENILRFRLWELDGLRTRVKLALARGMVDSEINAQNDYIAEIEITIKSMKYFQLLSTKHQDELLKKSLWKFSSQSLREKDKSKWSNSYSNLILLAGLKRDWHNNLYTHLSTHTHPHYVGVIQNKLSQEDVEMMQYVALMFGCFVTSFLIDDLAKRYKEPKAHLEKMDPKKIDVINSILKASRND